MNERKIDVAHRRQGQEREARLEIVAELYRRGWSVRMIRGEVMRRLGLATYSLWTVRKDRDRLLAEWRDARLKDMDALLALELERIDEAVRELWDQWEKSKNNRTATEKRKRGRPTRNPRVDENGNPVLGPDGRQVVERQIETTESWESGREVAGLGDPAYLREIRKWLERRDRLLGLNAPERVDVSGGLSFASLLVESGMLSDAEAEAGPGTAGTDPVPAETAAS